MAASSLGSGSGSVTVVALMDVGFCLWDGGSYGGASWDILCQGCEVEQGVVMLQIT
jgi:hypothetical protein